MWKLAAVLYLLTGPVAAGLAVLVGLTMPALGLNDLRGVALLGIGGLAAGLPLAFVLAGLLGGARRI